jgi:hypothetical protein
MTGTQSPSGASEPTDNRRVIRLPRVLAPSLFAKADVSTRFSSPDRDTCAESERRRYLRPWHEWLEERTPAPSMGRVFFPMTPDDRSDGDRERPKRPEIVAMSSYLSPFPIPGTPNRLRTSCAQTADKWGHWTPLDGTPRHDQRNDQHIRVRSTVVRIHLPQRGQARFPMMAAHIAHKTADQASRSAGRRSASRCSASFRCALVRRGGRSGRR